MKQGTASYTLPGDAAAVLLSVEMLYLEEYSEMRLTKALAEKLLQEAWENPMNRPWITHCRAVGRTAGVIAAAINEDAEFAEALNRALEDKDHPRVIVLNVWRSFVEPMIKGGARIDEFVEFK